MNAPEKNDKILLGASVKNDNSLDARKTVDDRSGSGTDAEMVVTGSMQFALTPSAAETLHSSEQVPDHSKSETVDVLSSNNDGVSLDSVKDKDKHEHESVDVQAASNGKTCSSEKVVSEESKETNEANKSTNSSSFVSSGNKSSTGSDVVGELPATVVRLIGPNGCEVFVVGTAHFSEESQKDVATTIEKVRPDVVVLELCRARTAILSLDEETILQESTNLDFAKMRAVIAQHGRVQGLLYLLLLSVSAHITKQLGMAPGGELRVAVSTVKRLLPKTVIQLGDRPINITLGRALAALSPWSKLKLAFHIITTAEPISKEDVEKCKNKDMIEELLAEMTGQFPAISEVFVQERDMYLSHSLHIACCPSHLTGHQPPRRVVGVVGIGHQRGIEQYWGKVTPEQLNSIITIPRSSYANRAVALTCRLSLYCLAGYCCYRLAKTSVGSRVTSSVVAVTSSVAAASVGLFEKGAAKAGLGGRS